MSEETEAMSDEMDEPFADEPSGDERKSHGPGLRLGIIIGLIAGAVVATLFAPPTGEETSESHATDAQTDEEIESPLNVDVDAPLARMRSMIEHVRARMHEASREAKLATREAEELALARYAELTHQDGTKS